MNKFIVVTDYKDDCKLAINIDKIEMITGSQKHKTGSQIYVTGDYCPYEVKESFDALCACIGAQYVDYTMDREDTY